VPSTGEFFVLAAALAIASLVEDVGDPPIFTSLVLHWNHQKPHTHTPLIFCKCVLITTINDEETVVVND
jgi:hypothetical protein